MPDRRLFSNIGLHQGGKMRQRIREPLDAGWERCTTEGEQVFEITSRDEPLPNSTPIPMHHQGNELHPSRALTSADFLAVPEDQYWCVKRGIGETNL